MKTEPPFPGLDRPIRAWMLFHPPARGDALGWFGARHRRWHGLPFFEARISRPTRASQGSERHLTAHCYGRHSSRRSHCGGGGDPSRRQAPKRLRHPAPELPPFPASLTRPCQSNPHACFLRKICILHSAHAGARNVARVVDKKPHRQDDRKVFSPGVQSACFQPI